MNCTKPERSTTKQVGIVPGLYTPAATCPSSQTRGNFTPVSARNFSMPLESSSTLTPSTASFPPNLSTKRWYVGNDSRHGAHHVAQKSTISTLPEKPLGPIGAPPPAGESEKSGALAPTSSL